MQTLAVATISEMTRGWFWGSVSSGMLLLFGIVLFFLALIVLTVVFYVSGLIVVGGKKAKLSDAFIISLLGTVVFNVFVMLIPVLGPFIALVVWLALIKHYYDTGWLGALAVAVLAVIVYFALLVLLLIIFALPLLLWNLFKFPFI